MQKIASLAAILANEPCSIADEKFSTFVAKFRCRDVRIVAIFIEFCEYFFDGSRDKTVNSDVVGGKQKYRICG